MTSADEPANAAADHSPALGPLATRTLFTGGWEFRAKVTAFAELGGSSGAKWSAVHLPHDALLTQARTADAARGETNGYFPGGAFEYRKTFAVPAEDRGRILHLEFDGVYRDAAVFVNGNLAGQRAFGYSRFTVRIDPYLAFGAENEIRVECRTHLDSRWYAGAGIYRDVHLIDQGPIHIAHDGVRVTTPTVEADSAVVEVAADVVNAGLTTETVRLDIQLVDDTGVTVARTSSPVTLLPGTRGTVRRRLLVEHPRLWGVDSPTLYQALLTLSCSAEHGTDESIALDSTSSTVGIRSLQLDPRHGLRVNGETVKLRGACIHLDNGPLGTVSMRAAEERKVARLKAAGFNAIRSSHNPMGTALIEACDRLGMLVMDETFDVWTSGKSDFDYSFDFPEWWERDIESIVAKNYNHPSVIFYSIGNEIPETGSPIGSAWGRRLAEKVRSLDPNRFVTNGINPFVAMIDTIVPQMKQRREAAEADASSGGGVNTMMAGFGQMMGQIQNSATATERTEESFAVLDVAGMNYSDSRYAEDRERFPDRIIVGTETWPGQIAENWRLVEADPGVIGDFTWTGWDYLGETGIGTIRYAGSGATGFSGGFPELTAWCGDIDITGRRRPISFYRETVFGLRSTPYIAVLSPDLHGMPIAVATPWSWTDAVASWSWDGHEGRPVTIEVYSDADEIELLVNGEPVGTAQVIGFRAVLDTVYRAGELTAVARKGGMETGRATLTTAGPERMLALTTENPELRLDGTDLGFLEIRLADPDGNQRTSEEAQVEIEITGPAVLAAFGSGSPRTAETFHSTSHSTFQGSALVVLRPTGPGEIRVRVTAERYAPAECTFLVP